MSSRKRSSSIVDPNLMELAERDFREHLNRTEENPTFDLNYLPSEVVGSDDSNQSSSKTDEDKSEIVTSGAKTVQLPGVAQPVLKVQKPIQKGYGPGRRLSFGNEPEDITSFDQQDWLLANNFYDRFYLNDEPLLPVTNNIPGGMELLIEEELIFLNQAVELVGNRGVVVTDPTDLGYEILDCTGNKLYLAVCRKSIFSSILPCSQETFTVKLYNYGGKIVSRIEGPGTRFGFMKGPATIYLPDGTLFGKIFSTKLFRLEYRIEDGSGNDIGYIRGPLLFATRPDEFRVKENRAAKSKIKTSDKIPDLDDIGVISGRWLSHFQTCSPFIDSKTSGLQFNKHTSVNLKMNLIAALFMIEYKWYNSATKVNSLLRIMTMTVAIVFLISFISYYLLLLK